MSVLRTISGDEPIITYEHINYPIQYKKGYEYHLQKDAVFFTNIRPKTAIITPFFEISRSGKVTARAGYAWDGSTRVKDTKYCMAPSLLHDIICQAVQEFGLDPEWKMIGDFEYYHAVRRNGMWPPRASLRLLGLQFHDWSKTSPRPVLEAPNVQIR